MTYTTPLDILNTSLQLLGQPRVATFTSTASKAAQDLAFAYDKLRLEELESNLWCFSTRRATLRAIGIDTVVWTPPTWVSATAYSAGAIVAYAPTSGPYVGETIVWQTKKAKTSSDTTTPDNDTDYSKFNGTLSIDLYNTGTEGDSTTSYSAGEVVLVPAAWASGTTYAINEVVRSSTTWYVSLAGSNLANAVTDTAWWAPWTSRGRSDGTFGVTATDSPIPLSFPGTVAVYVSLYNSNEDNPASSTVNWLSVAGTVQSLRIIWPIGAGPLHDLSTVNVFPLPNGFLKRAPSDPKGNQVPYLGARSGVPPEDWVVEDKYLTSRDAGPLTLRFVADVIDVSRMHALFCGALAARNASQNNEGVTQDNAKGNRAARDYVLAIRRARRQNAIEVGPITPVENRYVLVRG